LNTAHFAEPWDITMVISIKLNGSCPNTCKSKNST